MAIFKKLWWFFKQEKKHYLIGITALIVVALVQLIPPWVIGKVIDECGGKGIKIYEQKDYKAEELYHTLF